MASWNGAAVRHVRASGWPWRVAIPSSLFLSRWTAPLAFWPARRPASRRTRQRRQRRWAAFRRSTDA